jgi:hypothetical protein
MHPLLSIVQGVLGTLCITQPVFGKLHFLLHDIF